MFRNLKTKFAKVALTVLALQLAFMGLSTTTQVYAADSEYALATTGSIGNFSSPEKTIVDSGNTILTDGTAAITSANYFSAKDFKSVDVTLTKEAVNPAFDGKVKILPTNVPGIQLWAYSPVDELWFDVNKTGFGDASGTDIALYVDQTVSAFVVSNVENNYQISFNLVDAENDTSVIASAASEVIVKSPYSLIASDSLGNKGVLENSITDGSGNIIMVDSTNSPIADPDYLNDKSYKKIDVSLEQDTATPNYSGKARILPTQVAGVQAWVFVPGINLWFDVNQSGFGDLAGSDISAFVGNKVSVYVVASVDGVYPMNFSLVDVADNTLVASLSKSVVVDTTAPIVTTTVAPAAVTGLTTLVDSQGHVTLSWTNPTAGTYTGIRVYRVGEFYVDLDPSATTYTDLTAEKGKTYQYVVTVVNADGVTTSTPQITVAVPAAVVAAAVSDSFAPEATEVTAEVKADTAADETPLTKDEKGFPTWGIILLLILAAVGAYLIWSQNPAPVAAPVIAKTKDEPVSKSTKATTTTTTKKK